MSKPEAICVTIVALLIIVYLVFPEWAKYRLRMAELKMYKNEEDEEDQPEFDVKHLETLANAHNPLVCEICQEEIKLGSDCEKAEQVEAKTTQANRGEGITMPVD